MVAAKRVIMNLPATPLHRLLANSNLPDRVYNGQLYAPYPITAGKVQMVNARCDACFIDR